MARPKFKKQIDCSTFGCFSQIFDECNSFCEDVKQNKQSLQIKLNVWENENVDDIWKLISKAPRIDVVFAKSGNFHREGFERQNPQVCPG